MASLTKEYNEKHICEKFLDNANLHIHYNPHNNYLTLEFLVYGKVNEKYWKIIIHCDEIYMFKAETHWIPNIEKIEKYIIEPFVCLEVEITKNNVFEIDSEDNPTEHEIFSIRIFTTEKNLYIKCKFYNLELYELNEEEYSNLLYNSAD